MEICDNMKQRVCYILKIIPKTILAKTDPVKTILAKTDPAETTLAETSLAKTDLI